MDWGNVTIEDPINALREVDWSSLSRSLSLRILLVLSEFSQSNSFWSESMWLLHFVDCRQFAWYVLVKEMTMKHELNWVNKISSMLLLEEDELSMKEW